MKKLLPFLLMALAHAGLAATWTVNNNTSAIAQFASIQPAVDTASAGDTILLTGSATSYGEFNLGKQLVFIGEGYKDEDLSRKTQVDYIYCTSEDASFSVFRSLHIYSAPKKSAGFSGEVNGINFWDCYVSLNFSLLGESWSFQRVKILNDITTQGYVFHAENSDVGGISSSVGSAGSRVVNCVVDAYNEAYITFENCIIIKTPSTITGASYTNCIFRDNVTGTDLEDKQANHTECMFNVNPDWVNTTDYQLNEASLAKNAGTDGTDIGLTGGNYPIKKLNGENYLPVMNGVNVETSVIRPGEPLKLKFSAFQKQK